METHVQLDDVSVRFGDVSVLRGVSFTLGRGQIGVIIGGSGGGKTTLLRAIIGLVRPSAGAVLIDGEDIARLSDDALRRKRARSAMVFQYSALLDSLTVLENVVLPLQEHERLPAAELEARARDMLSSLELAGTEDRYPSELSGGMRKRVAIARALIRRPSLIVYDEPASGLDPITARKVDDLILHTRERFGVTSLVISHDMVQATRLADRLYVLADGRIIAEGSPAALKEVPGSLAAQFFEASGLA